MPAKRQAQARSATQRLSTAITMVGASSTKMRDDTRSLSSRPRQSRLLPATAVGAKHVHARPSQAHHTEGRTVSATTQPGSQRDDYARPSPIDHRKFSLTLSATAAAAATVSALKNTVRPAVRHLSRRMAASRRQAFGNLLAEARQP